MRPFFTLIIPYHNGQKTLKRLLDSVVSQKIDPNDLQIILCDDNSTVDYDYILKEFVGKLNLTIVFTKLRSVHCPGNTRLDAMKYALGEWIFFMDQDDYINPECLQEVKNYLKASDEKYFLATKMTCVDENGLPNNEVMLCDIAWLHGKFYNKDNLIDAYNIHFKENLKSHEDVYFNSQVIATLYRMGIYEYNYLDIQIYNWVSNPESITHTYVSKDGLDYLEDNYYDYLFSASEPFIETIINSRIVDDADKNIIIMVMLHGYFYWQSQVYKMGPEKSRNNFECLKEFRDRISNVLNMNTLEILDYIHSDPDKYIAVRSDCVRSRGNFIETTSLYNFMIKE